MVKAVGNTLLVVPSDIADLLMLVSRNMETTSTVLSALLQTMTGNQEGALATAKQAIAELRESKEKAMAIAQKISEAADEIES